MAKTITVKKGDTLSQILKDAGVSSYGSRSTWNTVAKASGIADPNKIWAGNKVVIPDTLLGKSSSSSTSKAPTSTSAPKPAPATSKELKDYLNEQQTKLQELEDYDPFGGDMEGTIDEAMEEISGGAEMPEAPKYMEMFEKMREEHGLDTLEQGLNQYKDLIRQEQNLLRQQRNDIRGGQTRMGVIEGRVDQATRDRMEMIDDYQRQAQFLADGINSAYSWIQLQMDITQLDYETTKEQYDSEFQKRFSLYETIKQEAREERNWKYQLMKDAEARASTHLSMVMDLISKGQTTWDSLSTAQRTQIHKMEVQAGIPMGFMSTVKMQAGANILSTTSRVDGSGNTYVDMLVQQPDGSIKVESKYTGKTRIPSSGGSSGPSYSERKDVAQRQDLSKITQGLEAGSGSDGYVSPTTYNANKSYWMSQGYSAKEFDEQFSNYVNPRHYKNIDTGVWSGTQYRISSDYIY
jgi:hypothetical protein